MRRLARWMAACALLASISGCCASPYRFWQNYIGWSDPVPDYYKPGPPPPITTPRGPTTPAVMPIPTTPST